MLVDEGGRAIGTEAKATVHHAATPLHLAFSSYVVDTAGRVLLTQRAADKPTWPGVWTNSCCGHPLPGEPVQDAVRRRLADELGIVTDAIELVLPEFRYRAEMPTGVVENELCPVYRVRWTGDPTPDPAEVASYRWADWPDPARRPRPLPVVPPPTGRAGPPGPDSRQLARWQTPPFSRPPPVYSSCSSRSACSATAVVLA